MFAVGDVFESVLLRDSEFPSLGLGSEGFGFVFLGVVWGFFWLKGFDTHTRTQQARLLWFGLHWLKGLGVWGFKGLKGFGSGGV